MTTKTKKKYYTVAEANATLPLVRSILRDITELAVDLQERHNRLARLKDASKFDQAELRALSQKTLHNFAYPAVADRLASLGVAGDEAPAFWLAVRGNLTRLSDARDWWDIAHGPIAPHEGDADVIQAAVAVLPGEPWDAQTWRMWTKAVGEATGLKGRALYHPLRLALTGRESGPELAAFLPLIGRARALDRLSARGV